MVFLFRCPKYDNRFSSGHSNPTATCGKLLLATLENKSTVPLLFQFTFSCRFNYSMKVWHTGDIQVTNLNADDVKNNRAPLKTGRKLDLSATSLQLYYFIIHDHKNLAHCYFNVSVFEHSYILLTSSTCPSSAPSLSFSSSSSSSYSSSSSSSSEDVSPVPSTCSIMGGCCA